MTAAILSFPPRRRTLANFDRVFDAVQTLAFDAAAVMEARNTDERTYTLAVYAMRITTTTLDLGSAMLAMRRQMAGEQIAPRAVLLAKPVCLDASGDEALDGLAARINALAPQVGALGRELVGVHQ